MRANMNAQVTGGCGGLAAGADTHHDHMRRGQDKSPNALKQPQNAPPEGYKYTSCLQNSIVHTDHVLLALGSCILKPLRVILIFILASVCRVIVCA